MAGVKFFFDNGRGALGQDGIPEPGGLPQKVIDLIESGDLENAPDFASLDEIMQGGVPSLSGPAHVASEQTYVAKYDPISPPAIAQFEPVFGSGKAIDDRTAGGPVVDDSVPGPKPIEPGPDAYANLQIPGSLSGPYAQAFTLEQLRDATNTDRYVYEGRRIRSASPCRSCKNGSEIFGVAELKSQTFTGIARRILCDKFKTDVTSNAVISCGAYEADAAKLPVKPVKQIERELRQRFNLTAPPATRYDAEAEAEEADIIKQALGEVVPSEQPKPDEAPLWNE